MQLQKPESIWVQLKRRDKVVKDMLMPLPLAAVFGDGLLQCCKAFDLAVPVVLGKHERDWQAFGRTVFFPSDFLEPFPFHSLELIAVKEDE